MLSDSQKRPLVFIPTYNEKDNVEWLLNGIQSLGLPIDILFLDDNSPDGTGELLEQLKARTSGMHVIHQAGKQGIGKAHKVGIQWAYEKGYQVLITMDADLTHSPKDIPRLLEHVQSFGVVLGSRYLQKNSLEGWNPLRKILTFVGNFLTSHLLGIKQDATGAFRAYRLDLVPAAIFSQVLSNSYSFFFESLYAINRSRISIKEVPISLPPRTYGSSKMQLSDIFGSVKILVFLFIRSKFQRTHDAIASKHEAERKI